MGAASFANTVTKYNRELAKSISSKYFRKTNSTKGQLSKSRIIHCDNSKASLVKAGKAKINRIIYELSIVILVAVLAVILLFNLGNSTMEKPITFNRTYKPVPEIQPSVEIYNYFVKAGLLAFSKGEIQSAQNEFQRALKISPSGLKANWGMALCLAFNCIHSDQDCQLALDYNEAILRATLETK